ncbi:hypothetical protein FB45DRAFT_894671 [Roridomyces roridus]|uniref:Uncharacterized protein n=1 Tax=Roridomyces roridus TaxID=1738132 RepID=A0AAD7FX61_9AGAR|nr:hypothetical protein FB45DRAFT_894671 [Roridomyces roridus]
MSSSRLYLATAPSSTSDGDHDQLSALGNSIRFKTLPPLRTALSESQRDLLDDIQDDFDDDFEAGEHVFHVDSRDRDGHSSFIDPRQLRLLVEQATSHTPDLIALWIQQSAMMQTPETAKNANLCRDVHNCLKAIPEATVPPTTYTPSEESKWRIRRREVGESLVKNLRKYDRYSDHLLRRPPRADEFYAALNKLHAFADKFFHLSRKLKASNEKLVLMELCESYEQMKLAQLEERKLRASVKADRAARKTEREMIRRQRRPP